MADLLEILRTTFDRLDLRAISDIGIVAFLIFWVLVLLRGTTAMSLLRGLLIVYIALFAFGTVFQLTVMQWVLRNSFIALLVAIPILFQPELRRALERLGRTRIGAMRGQVDTNLIDVVSIAATTLSERKHGALIVIERNTGLQDFVDTGRAQDAVATPELLSTIFFPNTPLHDGAVIIRDGRIIAAKCVLPITDEMRGSRYGMRHRAAVGLTERTDAVTVVVSEETGTISVMANGQIRPATDDMRLRRTLQDVLGPTAALPARRPHRNGNGK